MTLVNKAYISFQ